ncbi:hypothetical protein [Methylobacter sp. S3L5C]|uniref:hypothetical protein n=1 Tax=Methylobacter sp. S3L5C TaxID=2839024 RepID=UPI001FACE617|nr:hypothetical protein [Methylobacter sp. S3L5C]UOA08609.1 hypothetical protein KKZ03_20865 [Methylobacter sp. S3L5C]
MTKKPTITQIKEALTRRDAPLFTGELNLTLVGIRATDTNTNTFNDLLCVLYDDAAGKLQMQTFPITTDPGRKYLQKPINVDGTAILKPGHYKSCWQIGAHQGKYRALVQRGLMTVYRDRNKDNLLDLQHEQSGYFGINLHKARLSGYSLTTDVVSAGCQVFADSKDFDTVMALVQQSAAKYGSRFSYTLLDEADLCVPIKTKAA